MTATRRTSVLGLAVLLAAATAAADTVITTQEAISCSVESADSNFVRLRLPMHRKRMLHSEDVYEIRLSDSRRVAELAVQLPQVRIALDSGQPVPPPAVRAEQLRQERVREARAEDLPEYAVVVETLAPKASPAEMAARCWEMKAALLESERSNDTVAGLLREVNREAEALRRIWPQTATCLVSGPCGGLLVGSIGAFVGAGMATTPVTGLGLSEMALGCGYGCAAGSILGAITGLTIGREWRESLVAGHRNRVNDLIRRVTAPSLPRREAGPSA